MAFGEYERDRESEEFSTDGSISINGTPSREDIREEKAQDILDSLNLGNETKSGFKSKLKNFFEWGKVSNT